MERRKLFSEAPKVRRRLFSEEPVTEKHENDVVTKEVICMDCGYRMETASSNVDVICPKCGGKRFNVVRKVFSPEVVEEKVPIEVEGARTTGKRKVLNESEEDFQRAFSYTENPIELKLKEFSGKELTPEEFDKNFSCTAQELEGMGYCNIEESGNISIPSTAFCQSRMFSKLIVTVTRELDLDPEITCSSDPFKRDIINKLSDEGRFSPKGIIIMKKGHGIPVDKEHNDWMHDSGICNDLKLEFGGSRRELPEFERTICERYPDAPEGIIRLLSDKGIISINGNDVEISK